MTAVAISRLHFPVTTLGPGKRVGVWFQGCSIRCPGCISADTWPSGLGVTTVSEVLASVAEWVGDADGLTVSGGEPFEQPEALEALLSGWRSLSNTDVLVFTGLEFEKAKQVLTPLDNLIDALITGPYERTQPQTVALRGSDNQQLHILSEAGQKFGAYERPADATDKRLDVMFDENGGVWFAGIPQKGDLVRLHHALKQSGHRVTMSDQAVEPTS